MRITKLLKRSGKLFIQIITKTGQNTDMVYFYTDAMQIMYSIMFH